MSLTVYVNWFRTLLFLQQQQLASLMMATGNGNGAASSAAAAAAGGVSGRLASGESGHDDSDMESHFKSGEYYVQRPKVTQLK